VLECSREQRTVQVSAMEMVRHSEETYMDLTTLLIIVLILVLLGGGWFGRGRWY
jgi:hypothetical protein